MTGERHSDAGSPVVDGIAIGRAVVWACDPAPASVAGTTKEERGRLDRALRRATRGVEELVRLLPPDEAELFVPEIAILGELGPMLLARIDGGATPEEAVNEATSQVSTDLLLDARARLLDGLAEGNRSVEALLEGRDGDRVLVIESLTPSVVALLPGRFVGIVAASDGTAQSGGEYTSHAVILARGRGIPLAFVPPPVVLAIADDDTVVLDTTGSVASLWVAPSDSIIADAQRRRAEWVRGWTLEATKVAAPLAHLGVEVHVNIGSIHEVPPASADGIGLLRTELVFSGHARAPSEMEQFAALRAIAASVGHAPVVVRLFDAGGDKPLAWLEAPAGSPGARGIELLFMHPGLLETQVRAIVRTAEHASIRILLPLVTSAGDVERVRAISRGKVPVGAMVETPAAVDRIDEVAAAADFLCIGTNDLFALVTGQERNASSLSFDRRALRMIDRVIAGAHAHGLKVSVCGEMASDPHGAQVLVGLGVDAISVATARFAKVKLSLRDVTMADCRRVAQEALK
jgi:phosphocarrier protein FPr